MRPARPSIGHAGVCLALALAISALVLAIPASGATSTGAVISNGTVSLGVLATGDLNYDCAGAGDSGCPAASAGSGESIVGIRYVPNNTDAISPGCQCEGWGAADVGSGLSGGANESSGGTTNLTPVSFTASASTAVSVVDIADPSIPNAKMRVTQDYHPSAASANLYEDVVTIENTGSVAFTDLRYRRVMDWDVEPTAFSEWVTIQNPGSSPQLVFDSDNGFASEDPLSGPSYIDSESVCGVAYTGVCTFTNLGSGGTYPTVTSPADHGSLFDFSFGAVAPGTSIKFKVLYGAAPSQAQALAALAAAGAEVYSLGKSNCPEQFSTVAGCDALAANSGVELGLPNTFMFGFVTTSADIRITKTDSPDPVRVGQDLTFTLTVQNAGPNAASAVQVTDTLPAGVTFKSATSTKGTCSGSATVTCDLGTVANNATETVTIVVTPTNAGTLSNTATVSTASADANLANNSSTTTTTVNPRSANLSITKGDAPDPVTAGQSLTYTLTVANAGPDAAAAVTVSDPLPAGVSFVSATPSVGSCSGTSTVSCTLGTLNSGASATVTIVVTANNGPLSNTATVSSTTSDPNSANNSATATTTVNQPAASANLSITKGDAPDPVTAGQSLTYTLTVANAGPDAAAAVTVSDPLPAGVSFVSATPSVGSCSGTSTVSCTLGTLNSGASATVTIVVTANNGPLSNTATVSSTTSDPNSANNSATATTTVNAGNRPPICTGVTASMDALWPPNHKLVLVTLTGGTDPDGDSVAITIVGVTQDEPVKDNPLDEPDALIASPRGSVWLRAERNGDGDGRVYRISYIASDGKGGTCSGVVIVGVPHDVGAHDAAVDSGSVFDSFWG